MRNLLRVGILALVCLSLASPPATASTWDPQDTAGPLDLRWLHLAQAPRDRVRLTFSFWPGFRAGALAGDDTRGLLVRFHLPDLGYTAIGYTFFKDGHLRFRQGDFGSSTCCFRSRLERIDRRTLTTVFLPWWIRSGEQDNRGVRYWARTRVCRDPCLVDHTRRDVVT